MIELRGNIDASLLYIAPFYTLAEGSDARLILTLSKEWEGVPEITATFEREGEERRVALIDGECDVPRHMVIAPSFSLMVEGGERLRSGCIDVYVQPTLLRGDNA